MIGRAAAGLILAALLVASAGAAPLPRTILALYDSDDGVTDFENRIRQVIEMPLNHLGLNVVYHDLAGGLPPPDPGPDVRGVVVFLESNLMKDAAGYWTWLERQLVSGRRVVLINVPGPMRDRTSRRVVPFGLVNRVLARLGLRAGTASSSFPPDIELVHADRSRVEFERTLQNELVAFDEMNSIDPRNRVLLSLRLKSGGARSDAVVLGPSGGAAFSGYLYAFDPVSSKRQWRVDPFFFFAEALDVARTPRPDCTTRNGLRVFFSHVDGDGLTSLSLVDKVSGCGEVLLREILMRYPSLPVTVSLIAAEVDPGIAGSEASRETGRRIFALPHVEAATHTYTHPLVWNSAIVSRSVNGEYASEIEGTRENNGAILSYNPPGYVFDPGFEIGGSIRALERLLPRGKRIELVQWSGNCVPDEKALAAAAAAGVPNINGGDPRFDGEFPSYAHLAPLYRRVGPYLQVRTAACNENLYTELWTDRFGGFQKVVETFERTESPRRVSPVNVYYHFYSVEKPPALAALVAVMEWVRSRELFPVTASRYCRIVEGFASARFEPRGESAWTVTRNGQCRTVRFDDCALHPAVGPGTGVMGYRFHQGSLYVFLDDGPRHEITLSGTPPQRPWLESSTAEISALAGALPERLSFRAAAVAGARFTWANLEAGRTFRVTATRPGLRRTHVARSGADGRLVVSADVDGEASIEIRRLTEN